MSDCCGLARGFVDDSGEDTSSLPLQMTKKQHRRKIPQMFFHFLLPSQWRVRPALVHFASSEAIE